MTFPPAAVDDRLDGAWRRESLAVAGGPAQEGSDVLWLQAGSYFADLRTGPGTETAFTGWTRRRHDRIAFHRELDSDPRPVEDEAEIRFDRKRLVERGTARVGDRLIPYEEVWVRDRGPALHTRVLDGRESPAALITMRMVEVDGVAIVLVDNRRRRNGGFGAAEFRLGADGWRLARHFGADVPAPPAGWVLDEDGWLKAVEGEADWTRRVWTRRGNRTP